jgi:hypothetical protein
VNKRFEELARRKQALIDRCADQRAELSALCEKVRSPFDISGTLLGIGKMLKTHPMIAAGVSSLLVSGYAGRLLKSAGEIVHVWRLALPLWGWWTKRRKTH